MLRYVVLTAAYTKSNQLGYIMDFPKMGKVTPGIGWTWRPPDVASSCCWKAMLLGKEVLHLHKMTTRYLLDLLNHILQFHLLLSTFHTDNPKTIVFLLAALNL